MVGYPEVEGWDSNRYSQTISLDEGKSKLMTHSYKIIYMPS